MSRHLRLLALVAICCPLLTASADDKAPANPEAIDMSNIVQMMGGFDMPSPDDSNQFPEFDKITKDMVSKKGLFTLWYYPDGAQGKDSEKLLCQIPSSFLGEQFMLSTSFSGGGFLTGFPLDERVVMWELLDKQLLLVEPETRFVIDRSKEVSDAVRRTYPERIRVAVPLVTKAPNGDPVIDLGRLLKSDFADIGWASFMGGGFGGGAGIDYALSKWIKRKTFELNVEIGVELAVRSFSPPGSYDKKLVHYSFWKLPQSDYQPRVADDRVGYFLTANRDWSKPTTERDIFNRYVDRWHLVKRDPSLKLCEPRQPIIYYIEKTVPVKYRRAVRDGILEWNKAYEQVGFVNAVEVRQQTDDNEWKDLDPEDMRYSFFRWIVTGAGFAMGPHRANPFTGQIYDADIIFDDSMVRFFEHEAQFYLPSTVAATKFNDPVLSAFLEKHPEWKPPTHDWEAVQVRPDEEQQMRSVLYERMRDRGMHFCDYAQGMKQQMALAHTMLAGQPREVVDRFLYDVIKEVVMHEVGHTLGLRHNFKASSIYSLEEIQRRRTTGEALVGSVMDYNPALLFSKDATEGHFITPTIGPYDFWAIEYGYRQFDGSYTNNNAKSEDKESDEGDDDAEESGTETAVATAVHEMPAGHKIDLSQVPPEVLAQMPPEIRKMIESGDLDGAMTMAMGEAGSGMPMTPQKAASAPKFASAPSGEAGMLADIAGRAAEPELAYATDEDTTSASPDPTTNRFDMCSDPIAWASSRIDLVDSRMANILDWAVEDKESWYHLRSTYLTLMFERVNILDYVGRYIGGQYFNRSHKGDANADAPFVLVDAQRQREALKFIEDRLYSDNFFDTPVTLLNHLAPSRWWHDGTSINYAMDFPVHSYISTAQWWSLFDRMFPNTLRRIHDNELKSDSADKFTAAEYIQHIQNACWAASIDRKRASSGDWSDSKPYVSSVRRSLQREYLGVMEPLVREKPGNVISPDLHAMVCYSLQTLSEEIGNVLSSTKADKGLDFASKAHLTMCKSRIDRMLSAELREY